MGPQSEVGSEGRCVKEATEAGKEAEKEKEWVYVGKEWVYVPRQSRHRGQTPTQTLPYRFRFCGWVVYVCFSMSWYFCVWPGMVLNQRQLSIVVPD